MTQQLSSQEADIPHVRESKVSLLSNKDSRTTPEYKKVLERRTEVRNLLRTIDERIPFSGSYIPAVTSEEMEAEETRFFERRVANAENIELTVRQRLNPGDAELSFQEYAKYSAYKIRRFIEKERIYLARDEYEETIDDIDGNKRKMSEFNDCLFLILMEAVKDNINSGDYSAAFHLLLQLCDFVEVKKADVTFSEIDPKSMDDFKKYLIAHQLDYGLRAHPYIFAVMRDFAVKYGLLMREEVDKSEIVRSIAIKKLNAARGEPDFEELAEYYVELGICDACAVPKTVTKEWTGKEEEWCLRRNWYRTELRNFLYHYPYFKRYFPDFERKDHVGYNYRD